MTERDDSFLLVFSKQLAEPLHHTLNTFKEKDKQVIISTKSITVGMAGCAGRLAAIHLLASSSYTLRLFDRHHNRSLSS